MLPGTVTTPFSALVASIIVSKTYRFKVLNCVGWALVTLGFALMTTLSATSNDAKQYGFQVIYGLGGGTVFLARLCATQASQEDDNVAMATALVSFITSLGEAFGVAVGGTIFQNQWQRLVDKAVIQDRLPKQYILNSNLAAQAASLMIEFPPEIQILYRDIMAQVIDQVFIVLASLSGFAFLVSLIAKNLSLKRESNSTQGFIEKPVRVRNDTASPSHEPQSLPLGPS